MFQSSILLLRRRQRCSIPLRAFSSTKESFLTGTSSLYAEYMHELYQQKSPSLPESWNAYFTALEDAKELVIPDFQQPTAVPPVKKRQNVTVAVCSSGFACMLSLNAFLNLVSIASQNTTTILQQRTARLL